MHSGGGSPFSKNSWVSRECPIGHLLKTDWSLRVLRWWVRGSLTMGAIWWSLFSGDLPHGTDVFANDGFKIRGWDETGLHVGSARRFGGSIGMLVTKDADMARKPAEVNGKKRN